MLSRSELASVSERGRQLTADIEACLAELEILRGSQREAFSAGRVEELHRIRDQRGSLEEQALSLRAQLSSVLRELAEHATASLDTYRREVGGAGPPAVALPSRVEPDRIEDCRRYFEAVEQSVGAVVEQLLSFRREQLRDDVAQLRHLLSQLNSIGEGLPAVETYVDQETYVDLGLNEARKRLRAERSLVERKLVECEDRRREAERRRRVVDSRAALDRLCAASEASRPLEIGDLELAVLLLGYGSEDDARRIWSLMGAVFLAPTLAVFHERALQLTFELVGSCLAFAVEEPPFASVETIGTDGLVALDMLLAGGDDYPAKLARLCRVGEAGDQLVVSRLCRLKTCLPETAFRVLQLLGNERSVGIEGVATWFLAAPRGWKGHDVAVKWLARHCEDQELWKAAYASWLVSSAGDDRRSALLLVAAAIDPRLTPESEEVWWELLSESGRLFSSESLASVSAVATLVVWYRCGFPSTEVLRSCSSVRDTHQAIRSMMDLAIDIWPMSVAAHLRRFDAVQVERAALVERIEAFLVTVRTPAGQPSREFYREFVLPRLQDVFRTGGVAALAAVRGSIVSELLASQGRGLNPVAIHASERLVEEVVGLAAKVVAIDRDLKGLRNPEESRRVAAAIGKGLESTPDRLVRWALTMARDVVAGVGPTESAPEVVRWSRDSLVRALFAGNPVVDLSTESPGATVVWIAAMEEIKHAKDLPMWRIQYAVDAEEFGQARRYSETLGEVERAAMERSIADTYSKVRHVIEADLELSNDILDMLDPSDDVELARLYVEEARGALESEDSVRARKLLQEAVTEADRIERGQREARDRVVTEARETIAAGIDVLCRSSGRDASSLAGLLGGAVQAAYESGPTKLRQYVDAIRDVLAGRSFDVSLLSGASIGPLPAPVAPDGGRDSGQTGEVVACSAEKGPERMPVRLDELPRLVRSELEILVASSESALGELPAWELLRPDEAPAARENAAKALFRFEWARRGRWEEPLAAFLEERARQSFDGASYLRAGEYYLAAAQVAYRAATRLGRGLESARSNTFNYALARLVRLQVSLGNRAGPRGPVKSASARDWVRLAREYLLGHGGSDLAEVLTVLLNVVPDLAPEFLELPASEVLPMRSTVARALLQHPETLTGTGRDLLLLVTTYGLAPSAREMVTGFMERLCDSTATGLTSRAEEGQSRVLVELESECEMLPLEEQLLSTLKETVTGLQLGTRVLASPSSVEAHVIAVTKEVFLDAFERPEPVPVHLRISLSPESAILRDVVASLRTEHPEVEVAPTHRASEIPWLRGGEAIELACLLRRRPSSEDRRSKSVLTDLVLEVRDLGIRQEGVLTAGVVPYKGRRLSIQLRPTYPYADRLNPYSPGPAIRDLALIKGRDDEVRDILRTLRGRFQDNVPLIWGMRRIGKTTLLYKMKLDPSIRRHYEPVVCDMEGLIRQDDTTRRFLARLCRHIHEELQGTPAGRVPVPPITTGDPLDEFQSFLGRLVMVSGDRALLLMFDEMELFFDVLRDHQRTRSAGTYDECLHEDIIHLLRHNMQHNPKISFVLAGTKRLLDVAGAAGERLFHLPVPVQVGELREADASALIEEPVADIFRYSTAAKKRLLQLTERHPYLLQAICHELFSFMQTQRLSVCSESELERVVRERVFEQPGYFDFQLGQLRSSPVWRFVALAVAELTQEERRTDVPSIRARLELDEERAVYCEGLDGTLRELVEAGVLAEWRPRAEYRFRLPIVGAYLAHSCAR
jgi:hypothetical protein